MADLGRGFRQLNISLGYLFMKIERLTCWDQVIQLRSSIVIQLLSLIVIQLRSLIVIQLRSLMQSPFIVINFSLFIIYVKCIIINFSVHFDLSQFLIFLIFLGPESTNWTYLSNYMLFLKFRRRERQKKNRH